MTDVILHVGSVKTGSSYIQSSLALSEQALFESGYIYPDHPNNEAARLGRITSGNLSPRSDWTTELIKVSQSTYANGNALVYSNEQLAGTIIKSPDLFLDMARILKVRLIIYLRNPYDHFRSCYGQMVKRAGFYGEPGRYLSQYRHFENAASLVKLCKQFQIDLDVRNYDAALPQLLLDFSSALNLKSPLSQPPNSQINRSLTLDEAAFQKIFNEFYGALSHKFVSSVFCETIPQLKGDHELLTKAEFSELKEKVQPDLDVINDFISGGQKLKFSEPQGWRSRNETDKSNISLSEQHVVGLAKRFSQINRHCDIVSSRQADAISKVARLVNSLVAIKNSDTDTNDVIIEAYALLSTLKPDHPMLEARRDEAEADTCAEPSKAR